MAPDDHLVIARWIEIGMRAAFALLVVTFALYVLGLVEPLVPPQELARLWQLPVDRYVAATGAPTGAGWLRVLAKGDYLNVLGLSLFALLALACYARLVPLLLSQGRRVQALFAALQVLVILAAASGVLS
jgi:hypothetical protein